MRFMMVMIPRVYQPDTPPGQIFEVSDFPQDVRNAGDNPTVRVHLEKRKAS